MARDTATRSLVPSLGPGSGIGAGPGIGTSGVGDMKSTPGINCARFKNAREVPPRGI